MNKRKLRRMVQVKEFWRRFTKNKTAVLGLSIMIFILLIVIFADVIVPYSKCIEQAGAERLQGPGPKHFFGTDEYGRDLFARVIHGSRFSLFIGVATSLMALVFGSLIGASAGYFGGMTDSIMQRIVEIANSVPRLVIVSVLAIFMPKGMGLVIIALLLTEWIGMSKIARAEMLKSPSERNGADHCQYDHDDL